MEQDRSEAVKWLRMAAEEGDPLALRIVEMLEGLTPAGIGRRVRGVGALRAAGSLKFISPAAHRDLRRARGEGPGGDPAGASQPTRRVVRHEIPLTSGTHRLSETAAPGRHRRMLSTNKGTEVTIEDEFHSEMESLHGRTGQATGYWPGRFLQAVRNKGGLAVARKLLQPGPVTAGFDTLVKSARADLSVEFVALSKRFSGLFTTEELEEARRRLSALPRSAFPKSLPSSKFGTLGEVTDDTIYEEGAVQRISVNRFERDAKARGACIRHHGTQCVVCNFDFEERYGKPGRGFIHVHHTRPLHRLRASQRVDPKRDLVPVCPNCHAMLHRRDPPYDVEQLKLMLRPV